MNLKVKDPEVYCLARAIAKNTGETMTRAVTEALPERYERDPEVLAADIRALAKRTSSDIERPYLDHAEFLYDEKRSPEMILARQTFLPTGLSFTKIDVGSAPG